jgi:hypothetical protein
MDTEGGGITRILWWEEALLRRAGEPSLAIRDAWEDWSISLFILKVVELAASFFFVFGKN